MKIIGKPLGILAVAFAVLGAQVPADDPVMKARSQRAMAQGVQEGDLPPVPKGILEPPPLPPPELHTRDAKRTRGTAIHASKRSSHKVARTGKVAREHGKKAVSKSKPAKRGKRKH